MGEQEQMAGTPAHSPRREESWFLTKRGSGAGPEVGLKGWLRWSASLLVVECAGGHVLLLPGSSEVAAGFFWSFSILLPMICTN